MKRMLCLLAWTLNRHLYGPRTALVVWEIDTTMARVERISAARMPY